MGQGTLARFVLENGRQ